MADWTFQPEYPQDVEPDWQPTLITAFEDETEHRREKGVAHRDVIEEVYRVSEAELTAMQAFYAIYRMRTPFTRLSYRPGAAAGHEITVRFGAPIKYQYAGPDDFQARIQFVELVGE